MRPSRSHFFASVLRSGAFVHIQQEESNMTRPGFHILEPAFAEHAVWIWTVAGLAFWHFQVYPAMYGAIAASTYWLAQGLLQSFILKKVHG